MHHEGGRQLRLPITGADVAVTALALATILFGPASVFAQTVDFVTHANDPGNSYWDSVLGSGSGGCSACHALKAGASEAETSFIIKNARTIPDLRSLGVTTMPAKLGCTFCHNRLTASTKMKGVLGDFTGGKVSQHPVGRTFAGATPYADTNGEYLSSYRSNTADEMDCLDCHDQALIAPWVPNEGISCQDAGDPEDADNAGCYMQHQVPPANNPYMLKSVTVAGRYDAFCRTCHGTDVSVPATFKGKDIRLKSHADGRDTAANVLKEADGTLLLTSDSGKDGTADALTDQCTLCHSVHSSGNAKLFGSAYGNGAACTTCHLAGDRFDNYTRHGHGKATATYQQAGQTIPLARPCTACHFAMDVTTPNAAGTRKPHAEKTPAGSIQEIYQKRFNLNVSPLPGDAGTATGNPEWGICAGCHHLTRYKAHVSDEGVKAGCLDCHDEHAEGSGATPNILMIPAKAKRNGTYTGVDPARSRPGTEDVVYTQQRFEADGTTPRTGVNFDFYRADGRGICDSTECHGTTTSATSPGPLATLMGTAGNPGPHTTGYQSPGADCGSCHSHTSTAGSFRAPPAGGASAQASADAGTSASCDGCHLSSDPSVNTTEKVRSHRGDGESVATHDAHTNSSVVGGCDTCHPHDGRKVPPGEGSHMDGVIQFGGPRMPDTPEYEMSFGTATTCLDTPGGCHEGASGDWKSGLR